MLPPNNVRFLHAWMAVALMTGGLMTPHLVSASVPDAAFRPPAVPLVTSDPYLSVWSEADHLNDDVTRHWTRRPHPLVSLIRIDGKTFRLMGNDPADAPAFPQTRLQVLPTRSIYDFGDSHVRVTMTFMSALLPHDLDVFSRPLSYIIWDVRSIDGATHEIGLYDSTSSLLTVNTPSQPVVWGREESAGLTALKAGAANQTYFEPAGDDTRINWGYAYAATPSSAAESAIGGDAELIGSFGATGSLPRTDDARQPRPPTDDEPVMAFAFALGRVGASPVSRHVIVAYDEVYSIKWFGSRLRPYWRRNGAAPSDLLIAAERDYPVLLKRCRKFDEDLMADMTAQGGSRYARVAALAYRQAFAACGLVADANKQPLLLTKENTSNGDLATVDVIFPMSPIAEFFSPTLAKALAVPILAYAASAHWKYPNAPHDLGTYPVAWGRDDGGEAMPVEESGNMLILCDAISQEEGNTSFVNPYWSQLASWAKFLEQYGLDPENQLCTDDFMGHLAHNANLSVKAIVALAAFGDLCRMRGDNGTASKYATLARADAQHWVDAAADGTHTRLAFDKPGTWSQKYNLVWDRILGLNAFAPGVSQQELAYYKTQLLPIGLPIDSRTKIAETPWTFFTAAMAPDQADFETLTNPLYDYVSATTVRDPLADSYMANNIRSGGMHARPVVGGVFARMLTDRSLWKKWAAGDEVQAAGWAPLPHPATTVDVIPSSQHQPQVWRYTTTKPSDNWIMPNFDDSAWKQGPGGFGTAGITPNAVVGTTWNTDDIWIRRNVTLPAGPFKNLAFWVYHDEDIDIYVNGILAAHEAGYVPRYELLDIANPKALALLVPGAKIELAVRCHQTTGGQDIDVGIVDVDRSE